MHTKTHMSFTVLIPARLASTRLPEKPLADIAGKPMVVRVAQRVTQGLAADARVQVVVACDSHLIIQACTAHGVEAILTRSDHVSGSDRLAEACEQLGLPDDHIVVNVQGDEPLIDPLLIDACAALLDAHPDCAVGTAAHPISSVADFLNPNIVKVVLDAAGRALLFSRAPLPWWRDAPLDAARVPTALPDPPPLRHVGIYAYRAAFLRQFPTLPLAPLERTEALEQLRVLWHGERIAVHVSARAPGAGVDTPEDLQRVRQLFGA